MMSRIISLFGKEGAGKTTIAISFAEVLNDLGYKTLLFSTETRFGILQRRLNMRIEKRQSMYFAFLEEYKDKSFYRRAKENLYISSLSDEDDITSYNEIEESIIKDSISQMKLDFDYIIVDATARATDELTYHFLQESDHIINIVESSIDGMLFQNAHLKLFESDMFKEKTIDILNKHNENLVNLQTIENTTNTKFKAVYKYNSNVLEDTINFEQNIMIKNISENLLLSEIVKDKNIKKIEVKGVRKLIAKLSGNC